MHYANKGGRFFETAKARKKRRTPLTERARPAPASYAVRRMAAMSVIERLSGSVSGICWSGDASINLSITASVASRFPA
jgi:hypothetical protein